MPNVPVHSPPLAAWLRTRAGDLIDASADLLLGAACPGCTAPGLGLCNYCASQLEAFQDLRRQTSDGLAVLIVHRYQPLAGRLIVSHKERGAWRLAKPLGQVIAERIKAEFGHELAGAIVTPVPSDPAAERERGYDHAYGLARVVAKQLGLPARRLLIRTRHVGDQVGRSALQRKLAQDSSMRLKAGKAADASLGHPIIIIDDVMTTGATLTEAARALHEADQRVWFAACVATSN